MHQFESSVNTLGIGIFEARFHGLWATSVTNKDSASWFFSFFSYSQSSTINAMS